jgi:hypothetical protein
MASTNEPTRHVVKRRRQIRDRACTRRHGASVTYGDPAWSRAPCPHYHQITPLPWAIGNCAKLAVMIAPCGREAGPDVDAPGPVSPCIFQSWSVSQPMHGPPVKRDTDLQVQVQLYAKLAVWHRLASLLFQGHVGINVNSNLVINIHMCRPQILVMRLEEKYDDASSISRMNTMVLDCFMSSHGVIPIRLIFVVLCYKIWCPW